MVTGQTRWMTIWTEQAFPNGHVQKAGKQWSEKPSCPLEHVGDREPHWASGWHAREEKLIWAMAEGSSFYLVKHRASVKDVHDFSVWEGRYEWVRTTGRSLW